MLTGCTPKLHGVFGNTPFRTTKGFPDWHLSSSNILVEDLFAAVKRSGRSTASVYWPITGCNPNVDYLINEYFFYHPGETESEEAILQRFAKQGSSEETLKAIRTMLDRFPVNHRNRTDDLTLDQTFDHFINGCSVELIRQFQPDLLLIHNCLLDTLRHRHGVFNERITAGLDTMDMWLGELFDVLEEQDLLESTNIALVSDHGQMNYARRLKLNTVFARSNFVEINEDGVVTDWKMFARSNGMSASIYVKNKEDEEFAYEYLKNLQTDGVWGFGRIFTRAEVKELYGLDGDFSFIVETDGITAFADDWLEPAVLPFDYSNYTGQKATHGYLPEKGPQPMFVGSGPKFKDGVTLPNCTVLDEAPTFAAILGSSMPHAEGRVLQELLTI